uniref:Uncharacterized protein n=1 Tax=Arundo donax TaxID=35708 RepID=A0A0A9C9A1_ARUDO
MEQDKSNHRNCTSTTRHKIITSIYLLHMAKVLDSQQSAAETTTSRVTINKNTNHYLNTV